MAAQKSVPRTAQKTTYSQSEPNSSQIKQSYNAPPPVQKPTSLFPIKNKSPQREELKSAETIVIHVSDERKNLKKNYMCWKDLLLQEMKYFKQHLDTTDSAEDIDISVQCDIDIFEWLMKYIWSEKPVITINNVVPILISADFLKMEKLIVECTTYIANNLYDMVKVPLDMSNISVEAMKMISNQVSLQVLDNFKDQRDCL